MQIADIGFCAPEDLDAICEIERMCFPSPWERDVLENDLRNRLGQLAYIKASLLAIPVGYAVLGRAARAAHLMNLAVHPDARNRGIGTQLMLAAETIAEEWGDSRMRLEVRASDRGVRDFYARLGFVYTAREKGYYAGGTEDALIMVCRLPLKRFWSEG
jgi:ribosomal-protein-alanine acetyltransferase